ncbi:MAG: hypothetical protein ACAI44_19610 [Candidatus Sericytochromatia bacterium]
MSIQTVKAGQQYAGSAQKTQQALQQQQTQTGEAAQQTSQVQDSDAAGRHESKCTELGNENLSEQASADRDMKYAGIQASVDEVTRIASGTFDVAVRFFG